MKRHTGSLTLRAPVVASLFAAAGQAETSARTLRKRADAHDLLIGSAVAVAAMDDPS